MSFLWTRVEEQFQFHLEFLNPNVVVLRNYDMLMTIEHVKELGSKVNLQKMKVEHVEEISTSNI